MNQGFIDKIYPGAKIVQDASGIPWRFAMVQAAHESRFGQSRLTENANNLFGVTADELLKKAGVPNTMVMEELRDWLKSRPEIPVILMQTEEESPYPPAKIKYWSRPGDVILKKVFGDGCRLMVERPFIRYGSWAESLQDWAARIVAHYPAAFMSARDSDFVGFAKGLQQGGYATSSSYAMDLVRLHQTLEMAEPTLPAPPITQLAAESSSDAPPSQPPSEDPPQNS
jgi:hypothetical protein